MLRHIGFIGQGYVGGAYADYFESRGFSAVRYSLDPPFAANKDRLIECSLVFVCVPTPATPGACFDCSIVEESLRLLTLRSGTLVVIKSTLLPGTTARLQNDFPTLVLLHSPEFLSVATAAHDAAHPWGNIIGLGADSVRHAVAAVAVRAILPRAPFNLTCSGTQAELIKYAHNLSAIMQILTVNTLFDVAQQEGESWGPVAAALAADPTIPARYSNPVFNGQRGAGGGCFIKDLVAFAGLSGSPLLRAAEQYNRTLLTEQDRDLADAVYGLDTSRKLV